MKKKVLKSSKKLETEFRNAEVKVVNLDIKKNQNRLNCSFLEILILRSESSCG